MADQLSQTMKFANNNVDAFQTNVPDVISTYFFFADCSFECLGKERAVNCE